MDRNDKDELDELRLTVGHVAMLVRLARAVNAMRDAEGVHEPPIPTDCIVDYLAAKEEAYQLAAQWEEEHPTHGR